MLSAILCLVVPTPVAAGEDAVRTQAQSLRQGRRETDE